MHEITSQLRAAVVEAPPSRIDLDHLIRTELRRRRHRRWVWGGTGVAAAVAVVAIVPTLIAGAPAPRPAVPWGGPASTAAPSDRVRLCVGVTPEASGPQPPTQSYGTVRARPTEEPAAGVERLTGALRDALRTRLPAGIRAESLQPQCTEPQFQYHPGYREYEVGATLRRGEESGRFLLRVRPTARDEAVADCSRGLNPEDCRVVRYPDGSLAAHSRLPEGKGKAQLTVWLTRPDGTTILAITNNFRNDVVGNQMESTATAGAPLLTLDQLAAVAMSPGLTLYP